MTYKETLLFIGKCLTISHEEKNKLSIEEELKSETVDWDFVVEVSTAHYVFPALYCNLKRADFLHYLPEELVNYMIHITDLNRERNQQIINQAKEINELLLSNNITPIFLKGTGNLLEGLYEDIAERMLGDIDFLVSNDQFEESIKILKNDGYNEKSKKFVNNTILNRHYPKITKKGRIAALEIHYKMISNDKYFNYKYIKQNLIKTAKNITLLSYNDQVIMTSLNRQINDRDYWYKSTSLRNSYDLYLLSKLTSVRKVLNNFEDKYFNYLNTFLASTYMLLNKPKSLSYDKTLGTDSFVKKQITFLEKSNKWEFNKKILDFYFLYKITFNTVFKAFFNKKYRIYIFDRIIKFKSIS